MRVCMHVCLRVCVNTNLHVFFLQDLQKADTESPETHSHGMHKSWHAQIKLPASYYKHRLGVLQTYQFFCL